MSRLEKLNSYEIKAILFIIGDLFFIHNVTRSEQELKIEIYPTYLSFFASNHSTPNM